MSAIREVPPGKKRAKLRELIEGVFADHGLDFQVYERPVRQLLKVSSRLQQRIVAESPANERVRFCSIYWAGPQDESMVTGGSQDSLLRLNGSQHGGVDLFRVTLDLEWESGEEAPGAGSFDAWENLIIGENPLGLVSTLRQEPVLHLDSGDTVYLSVPLNPSFPPGPRPVQDLGIEATHYGQFEVAVTHW
jgi:hypothetical protein